MSVRTSSEASWRPSTRATRTSPELIRRSEPHDGRESVAALEALPSAASSRLLRTIRRLARHPTEAVLLEGESGVGKTLLARAVHDLSPRAACVFIERDMATLGGELAPSDLFGHVKGAFTGAEGRREGAFVTANHGTLFLDELAKAALDVQSLLHTAVARGTITPVGSDRSLQVNVRCVFAMNIPLDECIAREIIHDDLAARISHFRVRIPPLRERMEDLPALVTFALQRAAEALGLERPPTVSDELFALFSRHTWPNNVREVLGAVARIVTEADGDPILRPSHIPDESSLVILRGRRFKTRLKPGDAAAAVKATAGNKSEAARRANCHRTTIYRRLLREGETSTADRCVPGCNTSTSAPQQ